MTIQENFKELNTLSRNVFGSKLSHEFPIWEKKLVDFKNELIGESFVINNPKATASCGCGLSFSF